MLLKIPKAPFLRAIVNINYCLPDVTYYFGNVILLYLNLNILLYCTIHRCLFLNPFKKEIHEIIIQVFFM